MEFPTLSNASTELNAPLPPTREVLNPTPVPDLGEIPPDPKTLLDLIPVEPCPDDVPLAIQLLTLALYDMLDQLERIKRYDHGDHGRGPAGA